MYGRHVRGQWLSWLQVSCRCLFVHSLVCVCVCVGVLVERPEKKRTGYKSCARKSNPPTLTNA